MARRSSPLEDLTKAASYLPWWVSLIIAAVAWLVLGAFATSDIKVTPDDPLGAVSGAIPRALALVGQYVVTAAFAIGALISLGRSWRDGRLFHRVTSHSPDASTRYQGQDVDPMLTMSWREFEHLVSEVYRRRGYSVMETPEGADGGVDLVARRQGQTVLVQCKQWRTRDVGVSVVRELLGVVSAKGANGGAVVTVGRFTGEARRFARGTSIELIDGDALRRLARDVANSAAAVANHAPIMVAEAPPVCPKCESPMVRRVAKQGANMGKEFFGCSRYPDCRGTRAL